MPEDEFPSDGNGEALLNMKESGDDLSIPREINFSIIFESIDSARHFVEMARLSKIEAVIETDSPHEKTADVTVKKYMVPTHRNITEFETFLDRLARPLGGANDGWGCFSA